MGYPVGLRDLYFAKMTSEGVYEAPVKLSEAITANVTPNYTITTLYGDDRAVAVANALGDIDISINTTDLKPAEYDLLMGTTRNAEGVIVDSVNNVPPYGALLFRLPFDDGGFRYYCYYKGRFQPFATTSNTKGSGVEFQTPTITGKFVAREDGNWRAHHESPATLTSVAQNWFTSVYAPLPRDTTPPTVTTNPADAATAVAVGANIVWTFSEAIQDSSLNDTNFFLMKASDGTLVPGALTINGAKTVVTLDPTANLTAATAYIAVATKNIKDLAGNPMATTSVTNFTTA
jgi:phi13 family phage major tail protein